MPIVTFIAFQFLFSIHRSPFRHFPRTINSIVSLEFGNVLALSLVAPLILCTAIRPIVLVVVVLLLLICVTVYLLAICRYGKGKSKFCLSASGISLVLLPVT